MFFRLEYPDRLVDATVNSFLNSVYLEKDRAQKRAGTVGIVVRSLLSDHKVPSSIVCRDLNICATFFSSY